MFNIISHPEIATHPSDGINESHLESCMSLLLSPPGFQLGLWHGGAPPAACTLPTTHSGACQPVFPLWDSAQVSSPQEDFLTCPTISHSQLWTRCCLCFSQPLCLVASYNPSSPRGSDTTFEIQCLRRTFSFSCELPLIGLACME